MEQADPFRVTSIDLQNLHNRVDLIGLTIEKITVESPANAIVAIDSCTVLSGLQMKSEKIVPGSALLISHSTLRNIIVNTIIETFELCSSTVTDTICFKRDPARIEFRLGYKDEKPDNFVRVLDLCGRSMQKLSIMMSSPVISKKSIEGRSV